MSQIVGPVDFSNASATQSYLTNLVSDLTPSNFQNSTNPYYLTDILTPGITQLSSGQLAFVGNTGVTSLSSFVQTNWLPLSIAVIVGIMLFGRK